MSFPEYGPPARLSSSIAARTAWSSAGAMVRAALSSSVVSPKVGSMPARSRAMTSIFSRSISRMESELGQSSMGSRGPGYGGSPGRVCCRRPGVFLLFPVCDEDGALFQPC